MNRKLVKALTLSLFASAAMTASANKVQIEIETRILDFDPQPGMKSTQAIEIDFALKKATSTFKTGVTSIGQAEIGSVRDKFVVENVDFSSTGRVGLTLRGQTASGVLLMPNINYKFNLAVTADGKGALTGCHDGYPAYKVTVKSKNVYKFDHKSLNLLNLFGTCDIVLPAAINF